MPLLQGTNHVRSYKCFLFNLKSASQVIFPTVAFIKSHRTLPSEDYIKVAFSLTSPVSL